MKEEMVDNDLEACGNCCSLPVEVPNSLDVNITSDIAKQLQNKQANKQITQPTTL